MSAPTITPVAIDAFVYIESIQVVDRHRKDLGDLTELMASIRDVDLLNPITLTRSSRLIAGQRRLEACRQLGWVEIPVRFVDSLDDAAKLLRAERDENICRKDMLPSEKASLGEALYEVAAQEARERQRVAGRVFGRGIASSSQEESYSQDRQETAQVVGEALGVGKTNYYELRYVYKAANDLDLPDDERQLAREALADIDSGTNVQKVARALRSRLRAKREAQEAKVAAMADTQPNADPADDDWIPAVNDSSIRATDRRRELIRTFAAGGYSSPQIAEKINITAATVRRIARDIGITIPADEAMGARTRKSIDSNRIVRETVQTIDDLGMGLSLVNYDELDRGEIENWTASLSESIRVLNRLNKRLKEMAQ